MSPVLMVLRLLRDPDVDNRIILKFALRQVKAIGYAKVLAALLGALMVGVSSFIKVPQIKKILSPATAAKRAQLAAGLSANSVRLETLAQFVHVTYNQQQRNSFVNYGESLLLGLQNAVLLLVLEYYRLRKELASYSVNPDKEQMQICMQKLAKPAVAIFASILFITKVASPSLVAALQVVNIPLAIAAKVPQIRRNAALRSTAHLSEITVGANVAGSLIRVFTTVSNFKRSRRRDVVLLAGYSTSFALNAVLASQIWCYGKGKGEAEKEE